MARNTFQDILKLDPTQHDVSIYLASLSGDQDVPSYREVQMTDDVIDDFRATVEDVLQRYRRQEDDLEVVSYVGGAKPDDHQIPWIDLSDHEFVAKQIRSLIDRELFDQFNTDDKSFVDELRFYVIVVHLEDQSPVYFFRTYTPKKELERSAYFASLFKDGQFDQISEPLFLFDRHLDCVSHNENMFILKQNNFQRIFDFFEMVEEAARENLNQIKQAIPINNFGSFAKACLGHQQKMFKLNNIASKEYLDRITMNDLRSVIDRHGLNVPITEQNGREMLQFKEADRWEILRLLDDDYLESRMTGNFYEANSKREYTAE